LAARSSPQSIARARGTSTGTKPAFHGPRPTEDVWGARR
jgi:hypothetical protein